jgi:hypothetical protein
LTAISDLESSTSTVGTFLVADTDAVVVVDVFVAEGGGGMGILPERPLRIRKPNIFAIGNVAAVGLAMDVELVVGAVELNVGLVVGVELGVELDVVVDKDVLVVLIAAVSTVVFKLPSSLLVADIYNGTTHVSKCIIQLQPTKQR